MTPQHPRTHPIHAVRQRHTSHALAVHRDRRTRCRFPDPCGCPACKNRWVLVLGDDGRERWPAQMEHEQGARMTAFLRSACYIAVAAIIAYHVYIFVSSGGAHL